MDIIQIIFNFINIKRMCKTRYTETRKDNSTNCQNVLWRLLLTYMWMYNMYIQLINWNVYVTCTGLPSLKEFVNNIYPYMEGYLENIILCTCMGFCGLWSRKNAIDSFFYIFSGPTFTVIIPLWNIKINQIIWWIKHAGCIA